MQLTLTDIAFERNDNLLFKHVNGVLSAGKLIEVRGANGCGKSTLLRVVAGFLKPLSGSLTWNNETEYQHEIHYLGHQNGIKGNLTVFENLSLFSALNNIKSNKEAIRAVLHQVKLASFSQKLSRLLSAGQLRRLNLAKLLLHKRWLWILDEPMTSLDKEGQAFLKQLLEQHLSGGGAAMIATHQPMEMGYPTEFIELGCSNVK